MAAAGSRQEAVGRYQIPECRQILLLNDDVHVAMGPQLFPDQGVDRPASIKPDGDAMALEQLDEGEDIR